MGTSFGGKAALWLAVRIPNGCRALVLEAPAAIRPPGTRAGLGHARADGGRLYAHPERMPPLRRATRVQAKQQRTGQAAAGPDRDAELEAAMRRLDTPTWCCSGRWTA